MKNALTAYARASATSNKPRLSRRITLVAVGAVTALAALVPLAASGAPDQRLYIGMNLHFTGATLVGTQQ
jgi:hypothetical protein